MEHLRTIITDYQTYATQIRQIRDQVFLVEQQIAREDEYDDRDTACVFALSFLGDRAVGTGRLDIPKGGKVGRVAVLADFRRRGIGRALMQALEEYVEQSDELNRLWFHAQKSAVPFYLALGYNVSGEEFLEANIPHVLMEKAF